MNTKKPFKLYLFEIVRKSLEGKQQKTVRDVRKDCSKHTKQDTIDIINTIKVRINVYDDE